LTAHTVVGFKRSPRPAPFIQRSAWLDLMPSELADLLEYLVATSLAMPAVLAVK
jgi:hypothetical protein